MKKILIAAATAVILISGLIFYKISHPSISRKAEDLREEMTSYQLQATMKMLDGEDLKTFLVTSAYLKEGDQDLFCVSLEDQSSRQQQRIIKNADGVFVIAPSLNRAFQFQSEWPFNSFKPYIMQTVMEVFDGDFEEEKIDGGYQVSSLLSYPSDPRVTHMDAIFDDDLNLKNVTLYDENETEIVMLDVTSFEWNPSLDKSLFEVTVQNEVSANISYAEDLPFYPLENLGNELVDQTKADINGSEKHVLRFSGEDYFTIVENSISVSESFMIEPMKGDILEMAGGIAVVSDEVVSLLDGDVICQVFSNDLSTEEKLQILSSMQNSVVIEP